MPSGRANLRRIHVSAKLRVCLIRRTTVTKRTGRPKTGRPPSYKPDYAIQATKLCKLGATDIDLADFFGVTVSTIHRWKIAYPIFCDALKVGKAVIDDQVERSLLNRALGYTYDAVKIFMPAGADDPVYAEYRQHVPPDTTACIFWLKNRRAQQWRDVHQHEVGQPGGFPHLDDAQLKAEIMKEIAELGLDKGSLATH
jgi:hypothetical protein